ncbi:MAG: hypothetical protein ACR2NA_02875 [Solirubrobacterales bacterium]
MSRRALELAALGLAALVAVALAVDAGVAGPGAADDLLRAGLATAVLWALGGFGLVRLLLPAAMWPHWPLFVLPVGAVAGGLVLTALGYAGLPFAVSLGLTLTAGVGLAGWSLRRPAPSPALIEAERAATVGGALLDPGDRVTRWLVPTLLVVLIACISLIPVFRTGYATVVGTSGDAHLAVGTAEFLRAENPRAIDPAEQIDQVPLVWRSKVPIYYELAAVATLSGQEVVEVFAVVGALALGLVAIGFGLCAHYLLRARPATMLLVVGLVVASGVTYYTVNHPYFNQTWGLLTLPWSLLLGLWALRAGSRGAGALAAVLLIVGAFAYPLMVPFPALALGAYGAWRLAARRRDGRSLGFARAFGPLLRRRRLYPLYAVALVAFVVPMVGVAEKLISGFAVVLGAGSLRSWGGDVFGYFPPAWFFSLPASRELPVLAGLLGVALLAAWGVRRAPRGVGVALGSVLLGALAFLVIFRVREFGWYFHFKVGAFLGPIAVTVAAVGLADLLARHRPAWLRLGAAMACALWLIAGVAAIREQITTTYPQLPREVTQLREVDRLVPAGASIRLDIDPEEQPWASFYLYRHPLTSASPLTWTQYPHVPQGRKAAYVLADPEVLRPLQATGPALFRNTRFVLYRLSPDVPGPETSSTRLVQTVEKVTLY